MSLLCYTSLAAPQHGPTTNKSTSVEPHITIELSDKDREKKGAEVREFIWRHWGEHQPGSILVTGYTKEGQKGDARYVFGTDENGTWYMEATMDRPYLKGNDWAHVEDLVYSIERIEPPKPGQTDLLIPETANVPATRYRLVLKDKEGKRFGRGSL